MSLVFVYVYSPKFTLPRIFGFVFLVMWFFQLAFIRKNIMLDIYERRMVILAALLIGYCAVNNYIIHKYSIIKCSYDILKNTLPMMIFIASKSLNVNKIKIVNIYLASSILPLLFGLIQINYNFFTINFVLKNIPMLSGPELTERYLFETARISGTDNISIAFAEHLGIFAFLAISKYLLKKEQIYIIYVLFIYFIILFTGTRSAIYGLPFSIVFTLFCYKTINIRKLVIFAGVWLILLMGLAAGQELFSVPHDRNRFGMDVNTYAKLTANIYGSFAVLKESPFFGLSRDMQWYAIWRGGLSLGEIISAREASWVGIYDTYHNILGSYLRNYGLIGLFLFLGMLWNILQKVMNRKDSIVRFLQLGVLIYFFQYGMLHNLSFMQSIYIWVIISIDRYESSYQFRREDRPPMKCVNPAIKFT